jgi:hypothetical protein
MAGDVPGRVFRQVEVRVQRIKPITKRSRGVGIAQVGGVTERVDQRPLALTSLSVIEGNSADPDQTGEPRPNQRSLLMSIVPRRLSLNIDGQRQAFTMAPAVLEEGTVKHPCRSLAGRRPPIDGEVISRPRPRLPGGYRTIARPSMSRRS